VPDNLREVYAHLVMHEDDGTTRDVAGLLAFGLFCNKLESWISRQKALDQKPPEQDEIDRHIRKDFGDDDYAGFRKQALDLFGTAALDFLQDDIKEAEEAAVASSIFGIVESRLAATDAAVSASASALGKDVGTRLGAMEVTIAKAGDFKRQVLIAIATAVTAPLVLGAGIAGAQWALQKYDSSMPNGSQTYRTLAPPPGDKTQPGGTPATEGVAPDHR
jgi:hypothetical protein